MADIYKGSTLNIAATTASSLAQSYFHGRDRTYKDPGHVQVTSADFAQTFAFMDTGIYHNNLQSSKAAPLYSRGWVLQERVLARRTLHLAATQLFWECHSTAACEFFPEVIPAFFRKRRWYNTPFKAVLDDWPQVVEQYTASELTYSSDRLIAIAGVARDFASRSALTYCAGLWVETLLRDLCWYSLGSSMVKRSDLLPGNMFPSWSWAVWDGASMRLLDRTCQIVKEYVNIKVDAIWATNDQFGNIKQATLLCESLYIVPVKLTWNGRRYTGSRLEKNYTLYIHDTRGQCKAHLDPGLNVDDAQYFLPIVSIVKNPGQVLLSMLLKRITDSRGQYTRVGLVEIELWEWDDDSIPRYSNFLSPSSENNNNPSLAESDSTSIRIDDTSRRHYAIEIV